MQTSRKPFHIQNDFHQFLVALKTLNEYVFALSIGSKKFFVHKSQHVSSMFFCYHTPTVQPVARMEYFRDITQPDAFVQRCIQNF